VAEVLSLYAEGQAVKTNDPARIAYAIDALLPFWGERPLADITPSTCDRYARERGVMPGTVRRELGTLSAAMNYLVRDSVLTRAVPVTLPAKPEPKDRWLTVSEAALLLNAARTSGGRGRGYLPLFILIGLYTGARKEQILSLRWPQVDMARGRISFAVPGRATTKKRRPTIPMPNRLRTFLRYAWARRASDTGTVLHIDGKSIARLNRGFALAAERAGFDDVTPHTLRHTCGTWLAQRGVPVWQIAGWLGQDPETTARIYAHHHPDYMGETLAAMDRRGRGNGN
jgi:integrase